MSEEARSTRILLAGDGRPFHHDVLREAASLAREHDAEVSVLQLLTIWGTGLGLPHPGLMPNRQEKEAALETVRAAVATLERLRVPLATHRITATRRPARTVVREARRIGAAMVVMGEAPRRGRLHRLLWRDEPRQVARRAPMEVRLVPHAPAVPGTRHTERSGKARHVRGAVDGGG